jgi:peptide/nickel transport system substrate-binding protein
MSDGIHGPLRRLAVVLTATSPLALIACGDGGDGGSGGTAASAYAGFCEEALARVDSFLADATAEPEEPLPARYGGTVVVAGTNDILGGMDALHATDFVANQHHMFVNLMTLLRYTESYEPAPWLAESWEIAPDTSSITFRLRDDVYWHDGDRTDAYDVAFTYNRATDPATAYPNPAFFDYYETGDGAVEVLDSLTIRIGMRPHAEALDVWRTFGIMPEHLLGDVPVADLATHPFNSRCPVGNGPFVFLSHLPQESWTFRANPAFPEALGGRPYVDRYVYRVIPDQSTLLAELLAGNVDLYFQVRADQARTIEQRDQVVLRSAEGREFVFIGWNVRRPQLSDARVRRALAMAVDRASIVENLTHGHARLAEASVPPFHFGFDESVGELVAYDPDAARALLAEAGWEDRDGDGVRENADGIPLAITLSYNAGNQTRADIGQVMRAQLQDVGVALRPEAVDYQALMGRVLDAESRDFDALFLNWAHEFRVDDSDLFHSDRLEGRYQFTGIQDPQLDDYLDSLRVVADRGRATDLWRAYQRRVAELQPFMFLYYPDRLSGVRTRVQNVEIDTRGEWVNIGLWYLDPAARGRR